MNDSDALEWDLAPTIPDLVLAVLGLTLVAVLLWMVYRSMQHPRLPILKEPGSPPRATWAGVVKYLLTTPFMIMFWMLVLLLLLATTAVERNAEQVALATASVVGASRLLAHVNHELAHEVAKNVPIVILGLLLVGGSFAGFERFDDVMDELSDETLQTYLIGLLLFDYVVTAIWFFVQRRRWLRRHARLGAGKPRRGAIRQAWDQWRRIGMS